MLVWRVWSSTSNIHSFFLPHFSINSNHLQAGSSNPLLPNKLKMIYCDKRNSIQEVSQVKSTIFVMYVDTTSECSMEGSWEGNPQIMIYTQSFLDLCFAMRHIVVSYMLLF